MVSSRPIDLSRSVNLIWCLDMFTLGREVKGLMRESCGASLSVARWVEMRRKVERREEAVWMGWIVGSVSGMPVSWVARLMIYINLDIFSSDFQNRGGRS